MVPKNRIPKGGTFFWEGGPPKISRIFADHPAPSQNSPNPSGPATPRAPEPDNDRHARQQHLAGATVASHVSG